MKITVITSNQPRHLALIEKLALAGFQVNAIIESATINPGKVQDLYKSSKLHAQYFKQVKESENYFFQGLRGIKNTDNILILRMGEINFLDKSHLKGFLNSDIYVIFGASYIKGWLCEFLISKSAINLHMGLSPFYRGSSCNFWACFDNNFEYVGATLHLLDEGLDSGSILKFIHADPKFVANPFLYTMSAVKAAHEGLVEMLHSETDYALQAVKQNIGLEVRYSRKSEFTEECISDFLSRDPINTDGSKLKARMVKLVETALKRDGIGRGIL